MTEERSGEPENIPPEPGGPTSAGEPPPLTAFAWRNGLVRPTRGRVLAGVCGAVARATNTDPILWRVIIAVLTIFGGFGVLAYLLAWLLLPADGDTASPVEALLGRGRSATSTVLTVIGGVIALVSVGAFVSEPFRPGILGAVLLGAAVLLLVRDQRGRIRPTAPGPDAAPYGPQPPASSGAQPGGPPPPPRPQPGPQPPYAPHGPFAAAGLPPQRFTPPSFPTAKPPGSRLGRLTISLLLIVLGALTVIGLTYHRIPVNGYLAAALATVALGLIIGAWFGRARWLIALGIALSIALTSVAGVGRINRDWRAGAVTWAPTSVSQLQSSYAQDAGDVRLDLTKVDFASAPGTVDLAVRVNAGSVVIVLPPHLDVIVDANIHVGNANVLGQNWNGLGLSPRTVENTGADGPGGGKLHVSTQVDVGNLEVSR